MVVFQASCAAHAHFPVRNSPWSKMYRRLDYQLCQIKNYNLTYALFALEPPAVGWDLACHHDCSHHGGTVSQVCWPQRRTIVESQILGVMSRRCAVLCADGCRGTVVGLGRGVPSTMKLLNTNGGERFFDFSVSRHHRNRYTEVLCLFHRLLLVCCYIVFIWLSTQTKRKLWRLMSLASGREPS